MKLISLELQQACLHEHQQYEFGEGLIGIFGPQGSGKSTSMNLAYAALTNDYSRIVNGQAGAVRQQAGSDPSRVILNAEHATTRFKVTRTLSPKVKHRLEVAGRKPLTKATEIQHYLDAVLGADRHLLDKYIFVKQWELIELFNMRASDRAKTFAHLCGTTYAEKLHELLGKQYGLDQPLANVRVDNTDDLRKEIGEYRSKIRSAKAICEELAEMRMTDAERAEFEKTVRLAHRRTEIATALEDKNKAESRKKSLAVAAHKAWKAAEATLTELSAVAANQRKKGERARRDLDAYLPSKQLWAGRQDSLARFAESQRKLEELTEPASKLRTVEEYDAELESLQKKMTPHQAVVQALGELEGIEEDAVCPTCGQDLDSALECLEAAMRALAPLEEEEKLLKRQRAERKSHDMAMRVYTQSREKIVTEIERLELALKETEDLVEPDEVDEEKLRAIIKASKKASEEVDTATREVSTAQSVRATKVAEHKAAKAAVEADEAELVRLTEYAEALESNQAALDQDRAAEIGYEKQAALIEEYTSSINAREQEIEGIQASLERSKKADVWLKDLARCRDIVHRDNLPHIVHHAALSSMEQEINDTLEQFESPFYVRTAEDLGYVAYFRDGTVMPDAGLSGGQQVILSLALRWVLNSKFASQIGMMVLDEPTAGLDSRHIVLLENALTGLKEVARSRGMQVIIITHELSLRGVFDQVITLDKAIA